MKLVIVLVLLAGVVGCGFAVYRTLDVQEVTNQIWMVRGAFGAIGLGCLCAALLVLKPKSDKKKKKKKS
jgi:hypothetical protein